MPLYEYECPICSTRNEAVRSYERRDISPICPGCRSYDQGMTRIPSLIGKTAKAWGDSQWGYMDYGLGQVVRSERHRQEIMKSKGLAEVSGYDIKSKL